MDTYKILKIEQNQVFCEKNENSFLGQRIYFIQDSILINSGRILEIRENYSLIILDNIANLMEISKVTVLFSKDVEFKLFDNLFGKKIDLNFFPSLEFSNSLVSLSENSRILNPLVREVPSLPLFTGITSIDIFNTLMKGQKIAFFILSEMDPFFLISKMNLQLKLNEDLIVVNSLISYSDENWEKINSLLKEEGIKERTISFVSKKEDSLFDRLRLMRYSLNYAQKLAFEQEKDVLMIISDLSEFCEILKSFSNMKKEIPGTDGFPFHLYSELATLHEYAGKLKGKKGSLTILTILSLYNNDIEHVTSDVVGYISEGQILFDKELFLKNFSFPVDLLKSLSRMMKNGIKKKRTFEFHSEIASQVLFSLKKAIEIETFLMIKGSEELTLVEKKYLEFKNFLEEKIINQEELRSFNDSQNIVLDSLKKLPFDELIKLGSKAKKKYGFF